MACSMKKQNILRVITQRGYATQTALKPLSATDVETSTTTNNVRLVSACRSSLLTKICISFKAGTRFELPDNLGVTHVMRKAVGLGTKNCTPFNIHRNLQQLGINLYASVDRETYSVTVEASPEKLGAALFYLNNTATKPCFKPWEIVDNVNHLKADYDVIPPEVKVLDLLHSAAYVNGLGNSVFCDVTRCSKVSFEHCMQYFKENFTLKRMQISSVGLEHSILEEFIPEIELESGVDSPTPKPTYFGHEVRLPNYKEYETYIAVAGESPGFTQKEYLTYAVLRYVYGNAPPMKYGNNQGILSSALDKKGLLSAVTGINYSYSDSGLTGFFLVADPACAAQALETVMSTLLKADITDKDVIRAKALCKFSFMSRGESTFILDELSRQTAIGPLKFPLEFAAAVDTVTTTDVKQAAKKIAQSKLSAAIYGDIASVPSIDIFKK